MKQNDKELVKWCQTEARTKGTDAYIQPGSQPARKMEEKKNNQMGTRIFTINDIS